MARVYAYAEGVIVGEDRDGKALFFPMPPEIELRNAVDRYGGMAVYGRTIGANEMRMIGLAENVLRYHQEREGTDDATVWSQDNPGEADLLGLSLRAALDLGFINE